MKRILVVVADHKDELIVAFKTIASYKKNGWEVEIIHTGPVANKTPGDIEDVLYKKMLETIPDIVITFDTTGMDNDPDHIRVCFATTFAFQKYAKWIENLLHDMEPAQQAFPKLYYACIPQSVMKYQIAKKEKLALSFEKPLRGTEDKKITTVIDGEYFIFRMHGIIEVFMGKNDHVADRL